MKIRIIQKIIDIIRLKELPYFLYAQPNIFEKIYLKFNREKENSYKHIFSLGGNCEIAFRQVLYFGFEETSLFNWCGSFEISKIIYALQNIDKIGENGFTPPAKEEMCKCHNTNLWFHYNDPIKVPDNENFNEVILKDLSEKIKYLKEKFLRILCDDTKKLYIYKVRKEDITADVEENLIKLHDILQNLGGRNFTLLIICESKYQNLIPYNSKYIVRSVDYFADNNCVTDRRFLNNGYKKIFNEFYYSEKPKNLKKKTYKFR